MLVTCVYVPSTFASSVEVEIPSAESAKQGAVLEAVKSAVRQACKRKFEQYGIPAAEKRFKVDVPLGDSWGSLLAQPIRVSGKSNKVRAHVVRDASNLRPSMKSRTELFL